MEAGKVQRSIEGTLLVLNMVIIIFEQLCRHVIPLFSLYIKKEFRRPTVIHLQQALAPHTPYTGSSTSSLFLFLNWETNVYLGKLDSGTYSYQTIHCTTNNSARISHFFPSSPYLEYVQLKLKRRCSSLKRKSLNHLVYQFIL